MDKPECVLRLIKVKEADSFNSFFYFFLRFEGKLMVEIGWICCKTD
jgi:hypothetical protein